ncbi:hypothetical protein [Pseudochryseolinea flava]|uniref:Uncharacterized protein n=1 Tax=Pseudochryseolinea flava TaxID=2059302 RepID=A0A364Y4M3_9BACT|nr:hypothetical protein [Pseudochryseolinea flava]RAW01274.1 hypothetical protein DQQ10_10205 [Pseudochryseolinea flava]
MILKVFKSIWFVSLLGLLTAMMLVYASLGEVVVIQQNGLDQVALSRESFFYIVLILSVVVNMTVYLIKLFYLKNEDFRSWYHGLVITINLFLVVSLFLINAFNSGERFDFSRIAFVIYGSVGLVVAWAIAWPVIKVFRRFSTKSTV